MAPPDFGYITCYIRKSGTGMPLIDGCFEAGNPIERSWVLQRLQRQAPQDRFMTVLNLEEVVRVMHQGLYPPPIPHRVPLIAVKWDLLKQVAKHALRAPDTLPSHIHFVVSKQDDILWKIYYNGHHYFEDLYYPYSKIAFTFEVSTASL